MNLRDIQEGECGGCDITGCQRGDGIEVGEE